MKSEKEILLMINKAEQEKKAVEKRADERMELDVLYLSGFIHGIKSSMK